MIQVPVVEIPPFPDHFRPSWNWQHQRCLNAAKEMAALINHPMLLAAWLMVYRPRSGTQLADLTDDAQDLIDACINNSSGSDEAAAWNRNALLKEYLDTFMADRKLEAQETDPLESQRRIAILVARLYTP